MCLYYQCLKTHLEQLHAQRGAVIIVYERLQGKVFGVIS